MKWTKISRCSASWLSSVKNSGAFTFFSDSEFPEIEVVAADAEVLNDVGDDATGHVARMPRKRNESVGSERIAVMPVASGRTKEFTANLTQTTVKLTAIPRGIFTHRSGGQHEFVAKSSRDGTTGFEQSFQMCLGSQLEPQSGLTTITPMRVAARQQSGFGNPNAIFILTELHFREWNNHDGTKVAFFLSGVKKDAYRFRTEANEVNSDGF